MNWKNIKEEVEMNQCKCCSGTGRIGFTWYIVPDDKECWLCKGSGRKTKLLIGVRRFVSHVISLNCIW